MPRTRMRNQAATFSRLSTPSGPQLLALPVSRDAITRNVRAVKDQIRRDSVMLRAAEQSDEFAIVGAYYDIATAEVRFL